MTINRHFWKYRYISNGVFEFALGYGERPLFSRWVFLGLVHVDRAGLVFIVVDVGAVWE